MVAPNYENWLVINAWNSHYNSVLCKTILCEVLQWQMWEIYRILNSQKTSHCSPSWVNYGMSIVCILDWIHLYCGLWEHLATIGVLFIPAYWWLDSIDMITGLESWLMVIPKSDNLLLKNVTFETHYFQWKGRHVESKVRHVLVCFRMWQY